MADYEKMYVVLCGAVDDVIAPLSNIPSAQKYAKTLHEALLKAEDIYISTSSYTEDET